MKDYIPNKMVCQCCGCETDIIINDGGIEYILCYNCASSLINLNLTSKQFHKILMNGHSTEEFLLHDDFYDKKGDAIQPIKIRGRR